MGNLSIDTSTISNDFQNCQYHSNNENRYISRTVFLCSRSLFPSFFALAHSFPPFSPSLTLSLLFRPRSHYPSFFALAHTFPPFSSSLTLSLLFRFRPHTFFFFLTTLASLFFFFALAHSFFLSLSLTPSSSLLFSFTIFLILLLPVYFLLFYIISFLPLPISFH
ncbi:unnamed protein product [Acanthosepion pharaonis]|uniref:Uncharacterized protein n=1 Tax=Acanthosepion pharaonis TaxID=158019 RepID=A0A812B1J9_ACAPH|nr:unnamed protein product [Sepia pharaonis]